MPAPVCGLSAPRRRDLADLRLRQRPETDGRPVRRAQAHLTPGEPLVEQRGNPHQHGRGELDHLQHDAVGDRVGGGYVVGAGQHAARILVPARVDDQGLGLFLLDPAGSGVILGDQEATSGEIRSSLDLSGAVVDHRSLLGPADGKAVADLVRFSTAGLCATEAGVVARAVRMTADYTSTREQFGKPVASFQAVAQRAADAFVDLEAIKLATWYAVSCLDRGEAADEALAVAKYWASEGGHSAVYACQHLHGGTGVDNDYPLHRYYLWSKQIELTLGGAEFHLASLGKMLAAG